jgi:oxygen-independent coproporphyrinogen-3 oxidase
MEFYSPFFKDITMSSLYFGGGTPSLLDTDTLNDIFEAIFRNFRFRKKTQINFEAHPSSLTLDKIKLLKHYGVNRISLGVQTLDKTVLKEINRIQDEKMVFQAIKNIQKLNFSYINVDLIAGLPKQTTEIFIKDLRKIITCKPDVIHINPLSDISFSLYYKIRGLPNMKKIFTRRKEMVATAKKILLSKGYSLIDFEAFGLTRKAKNYQQFYSLAQAGTILGLGPYSNTILFDKVVYKALPSPRDLFKLHFYGYPINKRYNMSQFIILNLLNGFSNKKFKKIFRINITDVFKGELGFLKNNSIISNNGNFLKYCGDWKMESLFDYFSFTKIFYGQYILSELKKKYRITYNPSHKYNFRQDSFKKKMEDPFFLLTVDKAGF